MSKPWYTYPRDNNFGFYPDPMGPYPKPDSNIHAPGGLPCTALAAGIVTGVDYPAWGLGQPSVTIKMDTPYNDVATHTAYNFLSSASVRVGEHVNAGDEIGKTGATPLGTAFAFSAGDVYGQGQGWAQNVKGSWINPKLNPTAFLNSFSPGNGSVGSGTPILPSSPSSFSGTGTDALTQLGEYIVNKVGINQTVIDAIATINSQPFQIVGIAAIGIAGALFLAAWFLMNGGL